MQTRSGKRTGDAPPLSSSRRSRKCFRLLDLPREIRDGILRELLYSPHPLRYRDAENANIYADTFTQQSKQSFAFYPEILRTCKQLYMEGAPILQNANTIGLNYWLGYHPLMYVSCMGRKPVRGCSWGTLFGDGRQKVCQTSKSMSIVIHLEVPELITEETAWELRLFTHELCESLMDHKEELAKSRLEIVWTGPKQPVDQDNPIGQKLLDGFALLRPKEVIIKGFPQDYTASLEKSMLSAEPAENLFAMRDALIMYLEPTYSEYYYELGGWSDIEEAVWTCDHKSFKEARNAIIEQVEAHREELKRRVYEHDIDSPSPSTMSQAF